MDERIINVAMQIILHAGDARNQASEAIDELLNGNEEKCDELLQLADQSIKEAHKAQTNIIQDEARGNSIELSVLFIHAQDTLMTIATEVNLSKKMRLMYSKLKEEEKQ